MHRPVAGLQLSTVPGLPSSQFFGVPVQAPFEHVSDTVQRFASSHAAVLNVCVQPVAPLQVSVVQTLPSSQLIGVLVHEPVAALQLSAVQTLPSLQFFGVPAHAPALQTSLTVQALPSSQGFELLAW